MKVYLYNKRPSVVTIGSTGRVIQLMPGAVTAVARADYDKAVKDPVFQAWLGPDGFLVEVPESEAGRVAAPQKEEPPKTKSRTEEVEPVVLEEGFEASEPFQPTYEEPVFGDEDTAVDSVQSTSDLLLTEAKELVYGTTDEAKLKSWLETETRKGVRKALAEQLSELGAD